MPEIAPVFPIKSTLDFRRLVRHSLHTVSTPSNVIPNANPWALARAAGEDPGSALDPSARPRPRTGRPLTELMSQAGRALIARQVGGAEVAERYVTVEAGDTNRNLQAAKTPPTVILAAELAPEGKELRLGDVDQGMLRGAMEGHAEVTAPFRSGEGSKVEQG